MAVTKIHPIKTTLKKAIDYICNGDKTDDEIYVRTGYGRNDDWRMVRDIRMEKTADGWETSFSVMDDSRLNLCFRDNKYKWDNNYGRNWSFAVHNGGLRI